MKIYRKFNNIIGWLVFAIASTVYILTSESTASFWDCGEYIATSYKLMVGHPPGAPTFQLLGRFFSLFAFGDTALVARMVNTLSALASGFTILFLFWSITMLAKKFIIKNNEYTIGEMAAVFGAGIVGSLAYTFTDSFWFSAVEGEVYATSSFFTAIVFWAMLKWEESAEEKNSLRWIILIAYLVGLSIGVHLLNLLTIPAMVFIYYFKKYKATRKGIILSFVFSIILLALIQNGIIPWVVKLAGLFELFFVNNIGMPFNSGTLIYFVLLISGILWGLHYTIKNQKLLLNTIILCFTFILIGYSTFFILVIRANADTVINENNPDNAINMLAYLKREQYGDWPILYGPFYDAPLDKSKPYKDGSPVYTKDKKTGKYIITDSRKESIPNYAPEFCTIFPRMYSPQSDHKRAYKHWGKIVGTPIEYEDDYGKTKTIIKPTFGENLRFFFNYQVGFMYLRYFMWNFAGRQNDIQGDGNVTEGNWISGIKWIDEMRLGPQDNLPDALKNNKGRNAFYFLPLILGLIGFYYHLKRDPKDAWIVSLLFVMTGLAIIVYLNQYPNQPRERDYAYAASFYVFCIWIGIGVLALYELFMKKLKPLQSAVIASVLCLIVPAVLAKDGWDDHDRSNRYACRDFAINYLQSCAPNAIIFTNGDNDTFPLWYAQEVEGIRTDVRVCNLSLLNTDWYIHQMKRKAYDSDPIPFSFTEEQYRQGTRDYVYYYEDTTICKPNQYYPLKDIIDFIKSDDPRTKYVSNSGSISLFPTRNFKIPADAETAVKTGTVKPNEAALVQPIEWKVRAKSGIQKNTLMTLDLLAHNNWKRPVYFAISTGPEAYIGLEPWFQLEGLAYRLKPIKNDEENKSGQTGSIDTDILYDNMMNKFRWGNIDKEGVYLNQDILRMTMNFRNNFARLAEALIKENKKEKALKVLDRCLQVMPESKIPFDYFSLPLASAYYKAGAPDKGKYILNKLYDITAKNIKYYYSFKGDLAQTVGYEKRQNLAIMSNLGHIARENKEKVVADKAVSLLSQYYEDTKYLYEDQEEE
ncbi:MAG: DUF2723 domain-containing protein [Bacteroidales bacterium]|nr:DUF2723 domain-containing protein [Bacteroidales bacterium]